MPEIELLMNAQRLKEKDKARDMHLLAWLTVSAGATKKDGKPVYRKFTDFFKYKEKEEKPNRFINLSKHMKEKQQCNRK